jgi:DMSO/TMAO reductase YedYZ molybdopterin-dependent catalytic subunit
VLGDRPLVAETPEHLLDDDTTPIAKFFIRNNGQVPDAAANPDAWKLVIDGEVNNRLELTLGELKQRFQPKTYRMVLECGGNGRSFFQPQAAAIPGPMAAWAARNGPACRCTRCSKPPASSPRRSTPRITAPTRISRAIRRRNRSPAACRWRKPWTR